MVWDGHLEREKGKGKGMLLWPGLAGEKCMGINEELLLECYDRIKGVAVIVWLEKTTTIQGILLLVLQVLSLGEERKVRNCGEYCCYVARNVWPEFGVLNDSKRTNFHLLAVI